MMKIDIEIPSTADLLRAAIAEIEKQVTIKARNVAARHGEVTIRFSRKPDGNIQTIEFQGSQAAIEAAKVAVSN